VGQTIEVATETLGEIALFSTDRSITGQDGAGFTRDEDVVRPTFPAQLAARLFAADPQIDHVYVASNQVVVRRRVAWTEETAGAAAAVIAEFFRYYPDQ
jgi:hypothetical protein